MCVLVSMETFYLYFDVHRTQCALIGVQQLQMAKLVEEVVFCGKDSQQRRCHVLSVNFRRLRSSVGGGDSTSGAGSEALLHALAGLYSASLPDMEVPAIYASLTAAGTKTVVIATSAEAVLHNRKAGGQLMRPVPAQMPPGSEGCGSAGSATVDTSSSRAAAEQTPPSHPGRTQSGDRAGPTAQRTGSMETAAADPEELSPFAELFSGSESSGEEESEAGEDEFATGREAFLTEARHRKCLEPHSVDSIGPEHCVVGSATILRLTSKPGCSTVQLSLLAVRRSCRRMGVGKYLMQCCKDPDIVGHYDVLLAFADHKAEGFFSRHGFTDDPILTARYRDLVEDWENSTLMAYISPFSGPSGTVPSLRALSHFEEHFKTWRESAITSYWEQLGFLERVRHEVLLLHGRLQSQDEVIEELGRQLRQARQERALLQQEFEQYRTHVQGLMRDAAASSAERWLEAVQPKSQ